MKQKLLNAHQQNQLKEFVTLLLQWNKTFNLTAIRKEDEIETKHINDSLSIGPYLHGERIIDVGTGGGLPGIPLAIAYPEKQFVLLDSNGKKTAFLTQVRHKLGLKNVTVVQARVESYTDTQGFDSILTRAFSSLEEMVQKTHHLLAPQAQFLAMKGQNPESELTNLPKGFRIESIIELKVQGLMSARHLVIIQR